MPEEVDTGLLLRSSATSGALLILPEGGKSTNSQHLTKFRQHAAECAESWYDFVNGPLARGVHNDAIYLVTGATGVQGGAAARALLNAGANVRCFVRDSSKPAALELAALGATLAVGEYGNEQAIQKAMEGVTGVFVRSFTFSLR